MIEAILYFVLGLLTAGLLALAVAPLTWRRAERLARRKVEAGLPLSFDEIRAEKDQLRAEFAVTTRQLEMKSERLEASAGRSMLEVAQGRTEVARLEADRAAKADLIEGLEAQILERTSQLGAAEQRIEALQGDLAARGEDMQAREAEIKERDSELAAALQMAEEQKVELVARETHIGNLGDTVQEAETARDEAFTARNTMGTLLEGEKAALAAEQRRTEQLEAQIAAFGAERADRMAALDQRNREIKALEAELAAESVRREQLFTELQSLRESGDTSGGPVTAGHDRDSHTRAAEFAELSDRNAALNAELQGLRSEIDDLRRTTQEAPTEEIRSQLRQVAHAVVTMVEMKAAATAASPDAHHDPVSANGSGPENAPETAAANDETPAPVRSLVKRLRAYQQQAAAR